jgi:hypothetical protein
VEVSNSLGDVVPLETVEETQPSLSSGAIAGIAIGSVVLAAILITIVAVAVHKVSFKKGESYAYQRIGGGQPLPSQ